MRSFFLIVILSYSPYILNDLFYVLGGSLQETVPIKKKIVDSFWGVINFVSFL